MTHFFSRVRLKASPREARWLIPLSRHGVAYLDHALVWKLFPGDGAARDFVFRSERGDGDDPTAARTFYVVSQRQPQDVPAVFEVQTKPYQPLLVQGEWIRFDLRANPTISRRDAENKTHRHDVLMHAKRDARPEDARDAMDTAALHWLAQRASAWGLQLEEGGVVCSGYEQHRLQHKGRSIEFSSLDYKGRASVVDPERLVQAMLNGVGHSRGFGCGLLMVRRSG